MAKPERVEDLGKISVMLKMALDHDMWEFKDTFGRDKDFAEIFMETDKEKQHDRLHSLAYNMSSLRELIFDAKMIAEGDDFE